ncbi:MAG: branched-chain amino acid ABC transporter permease [Pseudomonadota bacterium]|jgi:branched-chain amino acid transport system permease protein
MTELIQHLADVIALGSIYALVALGLAIVFSVLRLINFAHGELLTLAAYGMVWTTGADWPWWLAIAASVGLALAGALVLERVSFRPVRNAEPTTLLLTSFAVSLILQNLFLMIAGPRPLAILYAPWAMNSFDISGLHLQWIQIVTTTVTVLCLAALHLTLNRTLLGIGLRAAAEDFRTTQLMGVRANWLTAGAFAISGALAGIAAVFWFASSGMVLPASGFTPVLKGFICAVIGGLGSLSGAVAAAYLLALIEIGFGFALPSDYQPYGEAFVFAVVILFLTFRPQGIFGQPERGI